MFCLNLHYTEANNYLFVNGVEIIKLKAEDSEINVIPLSRKHFKRDFMDIFTILLLIMMLLLLLIY